MRSVERSRRFTLFISDLICFFYGLSKNKSPTYIEAGFCFGFMKLYLYPPKVPFGDEYGRKGCSGDNRGKKRQGYYSQKEWIIPFL